MVERFVSYRNQADVYNSAAVMVRGLLTNVQPERDLFRNYLSSAREAPTAKFRNESDARAYEPDVVSARDNFRTELAQMRNCLTLFRERLSSYMPALLNIIDKIVGQGGQFGAASANPRLPITVLVCCNTNNFFVVSCGQAKLLFFVLSFVCRLRLQICWWLVCTPLFLRGRTLRRMCGFSCDLVKTVC